MAASPQDNLRRLYENGLKHYSLPDFDTFKQDMQDEEKRRRFYTNMQSNYTLPDFDTFSTDIGAVQVQTQPQAPATMQPGAPTTIDNTAQQATSVQTTVQPTQPTGWQPTAVQPTAVQRAAFQHQMDEMNASWDKMRTDFQTRVEGIKKGGRLDASLGTREFNPQTGKTETVYYTRQGDRVGTRMEQSQCNTAYNEWWETNTEEGKRSREQRLQREFDQRLGAMWYHIDPKDAPNAAEQTWAAAEAKFKQQRDANADREWNSYNALGGGPEHRTVTVSMNRHADMVDHLTTFDLDTLMQQAWDNLGEEGQQNLIDYCHQMLKYRNPGTDDLVLYHQAEQLARQQSNLRLYNLAVEKNMPQDKLEYFLRKVGDMNLILSLEKGLARSHAGKTGDLPAYEGAMGTWDKDNRVLGVAGTVVGFAVDPTTWLSAGVGSAASKGALWGMGRYAAGKGATTAMTNAAVRQIGTTYGGRIVAGVVGGAANFGTFEAIKEAENQFVHGGEVIAADENDDYRTQIIGYKVGDYSAGAIAKQGGHGMLMGAAIGWLGPVSGNVSDKLVRATASTAGKVGIRTGTFIGSTMAEGTIFSVPEWLSGERDAYDVWTDNMAMMIGFKVQHGLKSAPRTIEEFGRTADGRKGMESRLREYLDRPSDGGMALTKDEKAELEKYGYDLNEMVRDAGDPTKGELVIPNRETTRTEYDTGSNHFVEEETRQTALPSKLTEMVTDPRLSEAVRAKMYYYATGRRLPMSTIMYGELLGSEDGNNFTVQSIGANGVITSRSFKNRKAADLELERINRQAELNSVDIGEKYQQTEDFEKRLQDACRKVADENGWNAVDVYRLCSEARRDYKKRVSKEYDEAMQGVLGKVAEALGEYNEAEVTDAMRQRINEQYGVDIDKALAKEAKHRTGAEQAAIEQYIKELMPEKANEVIDVDAEDLTDQKLLGEDSEPIDPRFEDVADDNVITKSGGEENDTWQNQHPIGRAVMKYEDRPVEVLSGRVVMMEDGSMVDKEQSDATIVIRDVATGNIEMCSPDDILTYTPEPIVEGAGVEPEPIGAEPSGAGGAEPTRKYGAGIINIRNSDGSITQGYLTGHINEHGEYEYVTEGNNLHYASEYDLDNMVAEYIPDQAAEPIVAKDSQGNELAVGDEIVLSAGRRGVVQEIHPDGRVTVNHDGDIITYNEDFGDITATGLRKVAPEAPPAEQPTAPTEPQGGARVPDGMTADRTISVARRDGSTREYTVAKDQAGKQYVVDESGFMWGHDGNGENMKPYRPGESVSEWTDEQITRLSQPSNSDPEQPEIVPTSAETGENGANIVPNPAETAPTAPPTEQPTVEPTPLQRVPKDANGEPKFEATDHETAWDALVEYSEGDAVTAKEIADAMVEEKKKALDKAQKLKLKGKTPAEMLASKKANAAELDKAQKEFEQWQRIAGVEQRRKDAERSAREAEARQRAAERAAQEAAERAAREEAERIEREALNGVPEWHQDTPENARARGFRRFSGQKWERQEPLQGVVGKEVEVKFSSTDIPKGRVAVIEAEQLQPSHIQGERNPLFFIEEAQPKNRTDDVSKMAAKVMAEGIRPEEITGSATAYTGAPTVNTRGEVIQGNNRSDALLYLWDSGLSEQQGKYKQYLIDNAEQFGIDPTAVEAMSKPVLVNMLDVDDAEAIHLGQLTAQDTESGGIERIKAKNVAQKLGDNMRTFANMLLRSEDEEASFGQLVDRNGVDVLKWMNQTGAITPTQYQSAFDSKGNLTAEAKNDLSKVLYQAVFKGANQQLEELFDKLPAKAQRAILSTAFRDLDSPFSQRMLGEIQASIRAYTELMSDANFANAKKLEEVLRAVQAWTQQTALDDRFEKLVPADNYSNFALRLAAMYKANDYSQKTIATTFNEMYDMIQGTVKPDLFNPEPDTTPRTLAEAIREKLGIDYQPAKNDIDNGRNGSTDVALDHQPSEAGQRGSSEPPASGEPAEGGEEPADGGGRAATDSEAATEQPAEVSETASVDATESVQHAVEAASAEVNVTPTPAQAEAGNYKKGHVTVGDFDITIENPAGSVRSGVDANGTKWETTMSNTYGYIKGTEGVDGDHIDVFLAGDMDAWNGRKVFVVDQTKADGTFDEHKVMLGFNDKDEAFAAYLANYDKDWAQTHQGLRISEVNIDDFHKWIESSHRKTKPFADYSTVAKTTDNDPTGETISGEGYTIAPKPYTNKQGKTLDTYLVTFDRDFSKEEMSALRAKAKAVKGWYDRESKGWMLRSAEDAKAFAEEVMSKSEDEVADEAPLSIKDTTPAPKPTVKRVDINGVADALRTKGTATLSDHAEPIEQPFTPADASRYFGKKFTAGVNEWTITGYDGATGKFIAKQQDGVTRQLNADVVRDNVNLDTAEPKEQPKPGDHVELADGTSGDVLMRHNEQVAGEGESKVTGYTLTDGRKVKPEDITPQGQRPKPKKRNKWISDEDAAEFGNLMDDLRRELGGGDIVEEEGVGYGNKPKVKPMNAEVLRKGTIVTYMMMKGGLRKFSDYCEAMVDELGDAIRPHLKSLYAATQNMEEVIEAGWDEEMDDRKTVKSFDVYNFDKTSAVDLIETAQHVVDEQASQEDTENIINELKEKRNEQRRKEADETSANTAAIVDKAEAAASEVEDKLKDAADEETAEALAEHIDENIEKINKQLALLGYYEADPVDKDYNEAYGYMRNAERKATQDAHKLATQIATDLGLTIDIKDKVKKGKNRNFGSKLVSSNIAPAGGEVNIRIPLNAERDLYIRIALDPVDETGDRRHETRDDLRVTGIMYRVEGKGVNASNNFADPETTYDDLLADIKRVVRHYLPEEEVKPNTPVELQPGEDLLDMAERVSEASQPKKRTVEPEQRIGSLFDDFFAEQEENSTFVTPTTPNPDKHEKTDLRPGTGEAGGERGHQPRQDEPLGKGKRHEAERPDRRGMAGRDREHTVSDTERGTGVSATRESEQRIEPSECKNTRNNHAERGVDYAPKGEKARIDANIAAIELAQKLIEEGRTATKKEMEVLRRYSGWGGLGSAFNEKIGWQPNPIYKRLRELLSEEEYNAAVMSRNSAYYTPAPIIDTMWDIARALGFKGGNVLEGSAGIGNIIGLMPTDMSERSDIHAVEIDKTTGDILTLLYPDAKVEVQGFEQTHVGNGTVDLAITNVPFVPGLHVMDESGDSDLSKKFREIHDFCIAKNVRKLREGGIGIFITTKSSLDSSQKLRDWLVSDGRADVVGAFRLHNQTFGGTPATADIIVVRKRVNGRPSANAIDVSTVTAQRTSTFTNKYVNSRGKMVEDTKELPMLMNRYYIEHPECMGGEMRFGFEEGDTYRPMSRGLFPVRGKDQLQLMQEWAQRLGEMDWRSERLEQAINATHNENETLGEGVKEGSMLLDAKGRLCVAQRGRAVPIEVNGKKIKGRTKEECFKDYKAIKDALNAVLEYQTTNESDVGLQPLLDKLNKAYDTFVERYGNLNGNRNLPWLRADVDFSAIAALETYSERGVKEGGKVKKVVTYGKTDIFSRRVVDKESEPQPQNVKDGIIASIYKYGRIDTQYLGEQLGKSEAEIRKEIVESGLGFEDPTSGAMEVSYEYLSGNVREKLRQAKEANTDGRYNANIKALEAVVPMNIPAHLIEFTLGSPWIDPKLYERYVKERTGIDVTLTNAGGTWHMKEPYWTDEEKNKAMGVRSEKLEMLIPGHKLIEAAITNKSISVSRTYKNPDGSSETIVDKDATTACATKVDEIRQDFKDWAREQMQNDTEMSQRMEEVYNEQFNNSVPKSIPDEFVPEHFGGAATMVGGKPFRLRTHQAKAVIRATTQPVMLAHEVGTGKTYTLITTAMEMRRLGTARKPMIVVQNATVGQFVASAKALYPNAKILTLEDADRNAEGRRAFYAKIKYNDWDMIVVPQSVFERIPDSKERQIQFVQDKIAEKMLVLEQMKEADPDGKSWIVRQAEKEIQACEDEIAAIANGTAVESKGGKKKEKDAKKAAVARQNAEVKAKEMLDREVDDVEDFDSMGIDALLVDEAHEYKHLGFATAMQRGVKGVDSSFSKKSQGVYLKTQAVMQKTGGKNVVFATGTPISNTAAEIWTFMRYLMPADVMKDYGIYYFDDFVRNFGNLQQMMEFSTSGKYKENNRFAGYVNLPELVRIWSSVADTVLTRDAGGVTDKIPELESGKAQDIFLPQTRALRGIMKYVKAQLDAYENMTGKEKKENSHIPLVMYGIAKAAAVDARLVQADAEDDTHSKTNEAVRQTMRSLEETKDYSGTVAIFADSYQNKATGFNLYEDIRSKLIAAGVPEEQIVVMKSGMTVKKKAEIFDKVNAGEVRVIMGSTSTLGTGVNIQERLHTVIHLDAPNRPMDYTQRNGRILRQGNLHKDLGLPVRVLRFGVEDSLDVTAYQRLKTKGAIADSIMNGKQLMTNSMENRTIEEEQDLFGDMTAQLSGSEYALLKNQIEKEVKKLTAKLKQWEADQTYIHNRKRTLIGQIKSAEQRIAGDREALVKVETATIDGITVGKHTYASVDDMAEFIKEQNKKNRERQEDIRNSYSSRPTVSDLTVSVGGFDFNIHTEISKEVKSSQGTLFNSASTKMTYSCEALGLTDVPVHQQLIKNALTDIMDNVMTGKDMRERIETAERSIERNNAELSKLGEREGVPFEFADELATAKEKLAEAEELMKKELAEIEAKYAEMDAEVDEAQGVSFSEEDESDGVSEPEAEYLPERKKIGNFASRYETQDGKTINYTSENPEAYGVSEAGAEYGRGDSRATRSSVQRKNSALLATQHDRLGEGEYSHIERIFRESGAFEFTSGEKVRSAADVAFIFEQLENANVENAFAVLVKGGRPTVVHLSMGTFNATMVNVPVVKEAAARIKPDKVYFVHNHPGGELKCSPQDVQSLRNMEKALGMSVEGVIINLKSGKYGTFGTSDPNEIHDKDAAPEQQRRLRLYAFDRYVFAPDYDPTTPPEVPMDADAVAQYISSHRLGSRGKISYLIRANNGGITANIHSQFTEIGYDNIRDIADDIISHITNFGGTGAFIYGDYDYAGGNSNLYRVLNNVVRERSGDSYQVIDAVRVGGNATWSAQDRGLMEPGTEYGAKDGDLRYREVEDERVLDEFASGKTVKAYRTMQVIDGGLYSPMATKVGGKETPEIRLGVPEQSEEHPEIIKGSNVGKDGVEYGVVVINKGLGKGTLEVAYNPYIHASRTALNDQFTSAHVRPNLVTVEVEIPESELAGGYRAESAKNAVGEMPWHSGSVSGQLSDLGQPRRVILSRYDKPVRIVPYKEVAQMIAQQLAGTDIEIPYNVVQPQVAEELRKLGVRISDEASGSVGADEDFGRAEYITDEQIAAINARQRAMADESAEGKRRQVEAMSERLNTPVRIIENVEDITDADEAKQAKMRRAKGWYDTKSGEIVINLSRNRNVGDVAETMLHEIVAHKGLRELVGEEGYSDFLRDVYEHCKADVKKKIADKAAANGWDFEKATDEYLGELSEKGFEDFTEGERSIWQKLKQKVLDAINKLLKGIKLPKWVKLGDNELRYMLWRSHERLRRPETRDHRPETGEDYVAEARNISKREELGLSDELMYRDPGETDDIWQDGSLGLEERITNASIRLSNNQRGDLTLRNDAMRAVCDNLQTLLHDMRNRSGRATSFGGADAKVERGVAQSAKAQRLYDQVTAKRVGDLARVLMQNGYLRDMTSGEMQRIVSALKNATGAEDIASSVEKIMDIMIDNQVRSGKEALSELMSIRGSRVDSRGVEVQGTLDADGARMMQAVRRGMKLSEAEIQNKIAEAVSRMGDSDQTIADDAALEYAGMQIALDYVQNITGSKNEEKDLRDSLKDAKAEKDAGRMTDDAYNQLVEATEDAIRKNKIERAEAYNALVGRLSDSMRQSIENAKAWREAEKRRIQEIQHNANSDMQGMPSEMHRGKDTWKDGAANLVAATAFAPLATFEQMIRGIAGQKAADGEGYLYNRFVRGLNDARAKEISGYRGKQKKLDEKAKEIFSGSKHKVKSWGDVIRLERKLPKMRVTYFDKSANEFKDAELMQGNLLYIYMVDKMSDGRMKLRKMGITEGDVDAITDFLDPRIKALGDWLQEEFLVETRNEYNETHKRMFGTSMAAIDNYFPLKILGDARGIKEDIDAQDTIDGATSTITGAIKKRKVNTLALDILGADAFNVVLDHLAEMEHWNAYAEIGRDMNALLSYGKFRNRVKNMRTIYGAGDALWKRFKDVSRIAFGTYHQEVNDFDEGFLKIARGVTAAKVAFRLNTALKQTLSLPAVIPDMSVRGFIEGLKNPRNPFTWCMENLPIFEERWRSRISGDPRLMKSERGWNDWRNNVVELAGRWGMTPNAFIDAVICSIVAKTIYDTKLSHYLKDGYARAEAEARAKQDASIGYNLSQQSSEGAYLAPIQAKKNWLSVMWTVFRNSPMSYTRQVFDSVRNLKRNLTPGKHAEQIEYMTKQTLREWNIDPDNATDQERAKAKGAAKRRYGRSLRRDALRLLTYGFVLPGLWSLGGYWLYMLLGNDEDEKQQMKDDIYARLSTAPFEGLTGGDVLSNVASGYLNGTWNENTMTKDMPLSADITQIAKKLFKEDKTADGINDIFNLCVQSGFGFNPATIENAVLGILDACAGDVQLANEATIVAARILNCPESQVKKLYFDEIGMSGEEASKLSPAEIAERYARMQIKLGRPIMPWLWDDEAAIDKRMNGRYGTLTIAKERFERQGDPAVKEAYAGYAERYSAIDERVKAAKKLAQTDYVSAAQAMAEVQTDPDFTLYQQFGTLDKQLTKLSGMWIKSKSGAEATVIATAINDYRAAMVKVLGAPSFAEQQAALQELQGVMQQFSTDYAPYMPQPKLNR